MNEQVAYDLVDPDEKDERFDEVILLESDLDWKLTAEDCGPCWRMCEWDVYDTDVKKYWYVSSLWTIQKEHLKQLCRADLQEEQEK